MKLNGGNLLVDNESHIKGLIYSSPSTEEWSFPIRCYFGASKNKINEQLGIVEHDGKILWAATNKPFTAKQGFRMSKLSGANWTGRALTYNMLWGGSQAVQVFVFCISESNGPQVLCGNVQGLVAAYPKHNKMIEHKILDVVKTIVFVNSPKAPATSSTSPHGH